jgi:hypothetical protein
MMMMMMMIRGEMMMYRWVVGWDEVGDTPHNESLTGIQTVEHGWAHSRVSARDDHHLIQFYPPTTNW